MAKQKKQYKDRVIRVLDYVRQNGCLRIKAELKGEELTEKLFEKIRKKTREIKDRNIVGDRVFYNDLARAIFGNSPLYCSACKRSHHGKRGDCDAGFGFNDLRAYEFHIEEMEEMENNEARIDYIYNFLVEERGQFAGAEK